MFLFAFALTALSLLASEIFRVSPIPHSEYYYDLLKAMFYSSPFLFVFYFLLMVVFPIFLIYHVKQGVVSFLSYLLVTIPSLLVFYIVQYPSIHGWDHYSHSRYVDFIIESGNLGNFAGYLSYPISFLMSSFMSISLGVNSVLSGFLLLLILRLTLIILFYLIVKKMIMIMCENTFAFPFALLVLSTSFGFLGVHFSHFCPSLYAFIFVMLFFYLLISLNIESLQLMKLSLVPVVLLPLTHLPSTMVILILLAVLEISLLVMPDSIRYFEKRVSSKMVLLKFGQYTLLLTGIIFMAWHIYLAQGILKVALDIMVNRGIMADTPNYGPTLARIIQNFICGVIKVDQLTIMWTRFLLGIYVLMQIIILFFRPRVFLKDCVLSSLFIAGIIMIFIFSFLNLPVVMERTWEIFSICITLSLTLNLYNLFALKWNVSKIFRSLLSILFTLIFLISWLFSIGAPINMLPKTSISSVRLPELSEINFMSKYVGQSSRLVVDEMSVFVINYFFHSNQITSFNHREPIDTLLEKLALDHGSLLVFTYRYKLYVLSAHIDYFEYYSKDEAKKVIYMINDINMKVYDNSFTSMLINS